MVLVVMNLHLQGKSHYTRNGNKIDQVRRYGDGPQGSQTV